MSLLIVVEVFGCFGMLGLCIYLQLVGRLTRQRFGLFQIAPISLIVLTVGILNFSAEFPFGFVAILMANVGIWIIGYPLAKWAYVEILPRKKSGS